MSTSTAVGVDELMESSNQPQSLNNWEELGEQVLSLTGGPSQSVIGSSHVVPTAGAERVASYERWSSLRPNSSIAKIVTSVLAGVFPRLDEW
ncbi:hypothetical protein V3C99_001607 [Haemonchus contortus]